MYHKKETSKEKSIKCKGHESMGVEGKRDCLNFCNINVKIKYK